MNICICGGGNLGTVCAGVLSSQKGVSVSIFTRHPEKWSEQITVTDSEGKFYQGFLRMVSNDASVVIPEADIVLLCLPGFVIEDILKKIKPYLKEGTLVGSIVSSTGFFFMAHDTLAPNTPLFGFQRVPFIARSTEYGKSANLLGYKAQVAIAVENEEKEKVRSLFERLFFTSTILLNNYYEASLTNSNPILHTGRLYTLWKDWDGESYEEPILFYKEWTNEASQMIINMDNEFQHLLSFMSIDHTTIPDLLTYYESTDAASLTKKIQSIPAFQNIIAPMKKFDDKWYPDFTSRYFKEDFPFGLRFIYDLLLKNEIYCPCIKQVYSWGIQKIN